MQRLIAFISFAIIFSSCSNKSKSDLAIFKTAAIGFEQSIISTSSSNEYIYHALDDRWHNPRTTVFGPIWQPKTALIKEINEKMSNYIESLAKQLKQKAGLKTENGRERFEEDNEDAVTSLFVTQGKGRELQGKLNQYRNDMLAIDPEFLREFEQVIIDVSDSNYKSSFTNNYFHDIPVAGAFALLKRFESVTKITENNFLRFCLSKTSYSGCGFMTRVQAIVSQNSNYLKGGDKIEITAGIGSFYAAASPKITINNKVFKPGYIDGVAKYELKTPLKAGKYIIPVKVEFTDESGRKLYMEKRVEYTVIE